MFSICWMLVFRLLPCSKAASSQSVLLVHHPSCNVWWCKCQCNFILRSYGCQKQWNPNKRIAAHCWNPTHILTTIRHRGKKYICRRLLFRLYSNFTETLANTSQRWLINLVEIGSVVVGKNQRKNWWKGPMSQFFFST